MLDRARSDQQVALTTFKGKKLYRYLYEELRLQGYRFTLRSFADAVMSRVRHRATVSWLPDLERIAKRGIGNALSRLLLTPIGDPLRSHPTHAATLDTLDRMVSRVTLDGFDYAVINSDVKTENFAEKLAPLATVVREAMPDYRWTD